jgi:hypothetical protein
MPTLSSSSMFASRSRKLRQSPSASPAVHTVRARTEPKRPAPFTYLQIHAQVVHFVPFQGVLLPRTSLGFFSGRVGSSKLLWNAVRFAASLYWFSRSTRQHSSVVASVRCRTLGKIHHPVSSPTRLPPRSGCPCPLLKVLGRLVTSIPYWESLKVIAFDKTTVNRNFSSGYALAYIPR